MGQVNKDNTCIILTGTIVPNASFVAHADPKKRRDEYLQGLKFYSEMFPGFRIYFLENSIYDVEQDHEMMELNRQRKFDIIKLPVSDKFKEGKGYQEFLMIDGVIGMLKQQYKSFIKVTGRYRVANLRKICSEKKLSLQIDLHKKEKIAQTNVFACDFDFYDKYFLGLYKEANDSVGYFIEKAIYNKLITANLFADLEMFPENPMIEGISGSYGLNIRRNPYKLMLRNVERKVLRSFGIKQFLIEY